MADVRAVGIADLVRRDEHVVLYDRRAFLELHADRADEVVVLQVVDDDRVRFELAAGLVDGGLRAPWSAPFAELVAIGDQRTSRHHEAAAALHAAVGSYGWSGLRLTLPPGFLAPERTSQALQALLANGFETAWVDVNHHLDLVAEPSDDPEAGLAPRARQKLRAAGRNGLEVVDLDPEVDLDEAYAVIEANRAERGHPLRLGLEQVRAVARIAEVDLLGVRAPDGDLVGSSIAFRSTPRVSQVIYWGATAAGHDLRAMNLLAAGVRRHALRAGLLAVDLGPSSERGVPNAGLCDFKASVGAVASAKFTLVAGS